MKHFKPAILVMVLLFCGAYVSAQTAEEIIAKHIQSLGGIEQLSKVTSVYTESKIEVMGMEGVGKSWTLNGKGNRQDIDIMGNIITTCFNDKGGWSINPMTGSTTAEDMPEAQYKSGKEQIFVGGLFVNYTEKGYKPELIGNEAVDSLNTVKVKMTSPDGNSTLYYFDPLTGNLIKSISQMDVQGVLSDMEIKYLDYKQTDGYNLPYKMEMYIPSAQFSMTYTVTKVEVNQPVDEKMFEKPI